MRIEERKRVEYETIHDKSKPYSQAVQSMQCMIYAISGHGKTLAGEKITEKHHKRDFIIISITEKTQYPAVDVNKAIIMFHKELVKKKDQIDAASRIALNFLALYGIRHLAVLQLDNVYYTATNYHLLSFASGFAGGTTKKFIAPVLGFFGSIGPEIYQAAIRLQEDLNVNNLEDLGISAGIKAGVFTGSYIAGRVVHWMLK